ncbi:hypothetical protein [Actinokineospora sp.]|uniref:hypothetical protein n=1 Tax=Actinokineospora sp. TaxID=1872133 RepID=UPI004037721E
MEWQERLRELDAREAAGEVSAADHRRLRDEILAQASSRVSVRQAAGFGAKAPVQHAPLTSAPIPPARIATGQELVEGSAIFAGAREGRRTRVVLVVLAVVVVLAAVGGGVWWYLQRSDEQAPAAQQTQATRPGLSLDRLPNPTQNPLTTTGTFSVDQGLAAKLLKQEEVDYLTNGATQQVFFRAAAEDELSYQMFLFQTPGQEGATVVNSSIIAVGKEGRLVDAGISGLPAGVTATKATEVGLVQASYVTDGGTVRIIILQNGTRDDAKLTDALRRTVVLTARSLPAQSS